MYHIVHHFYFSISFSDYLTMRIFNKKQGISYFRNFQENFASSEMLAEIFWIFNQKNQKFCEIFLIQYM